MYREIRADYSQTVQATFTSSSGWDTYVSPPRSSIVTRANINGVWRIDRQWKAVSQSLATQFQPKDLERLAGRLNDFEIALTVEHALRTFQNSDGIKFVRRIQWFDLNARRNFQPTITCAGDTIDELVRDLSDMCLVALQEPTGHVNFVEDLLFEPRVAAVLVHEWLGHGVEEGKVEGYVGPSSLTVMAGFPTQAIYDDEGILTKSQLIVDAGLICTTSLSSRISGISGSGFAQAAIHDTNTEVRLTHLEVAAAPEEIVENDRAIRCIGTSGAELVGPVMFIHIDHAERLKETIFPFTAVVSLANLPTKLACVGASRKIQGARCVKRGASLPTLVSSPALLIRDVTCVSS